VPVPSVQNDRTCWRRTVQILHSSFRIGYSREGFLEKYFTHAVGYPSSGLILYKDSTPTGGCLSMQSASFRRKSFSPRLISLAEKWIECRFPARWDWPWNAFNRSSHQKG